MKEKSILLLGPCLVVIALGGLLTLVLDLDEVGKAVITVWFSMMLGSGFTIIIIYLSGNDIK